MMFNPTVFFKRKMKAQNYPEIFLSQFCIFLTVLILFICISPVHAKEKQYGSVEERRLESTLVQERESLKREREQLALREKELKTLEQGVDKKLAELDGKIEELRVLQKKIEALLRKKSLAEKKKTESLAKIYEKMNPVKAAQALSEVDEKLATSLLESMKVKSAAKILDQIARQKAAALSTEYSTLQIE